MIFKQLQNLSNFGETVESLKELSLAEQIAKLSSDELKETKIRLALSSIGVTEAQIDEAVSNSTVSLAQKTATGTTISLSNAYKGLAASIGISTAALTTFIGVAAGIVIVAAIAEKLHVSLEEAMESLDESVTSFKETTGEIENLNKELKITEDRIKELQKLSDAGTISIADKAELETLKEQNKELARQIALKQRQQITEGKEVLEDAQEVSSKTVMSKYEFVTQSNKEGTVVGADVSVEKELQLAMDAYGEAEEAIDKWNTELSKDNLSDKERKTAKTMLSMAEAKLANAQDRADEMYNILSVERQAYLDLDEAGYSLSTEDKERLNYLNGFNDVFLLWNHTLTQTKESFCSLNAEQQRSILLNRLLEQGLSDTQAQSVVTNISDDDLEEYWNKDFSFVPPEVKDYSSAEEYGKAYAKAWLNGFQSQTSEEDKGTNSFIDFGTNLQSKSKGFDILSPIYSDVKDGKYFDWSSILNNEEFKTQFGDMRNVTAEYKTVYDDFMKTIMESPDDINACQEAFNKLATAYIQNSDVLKDLNEENKEFAINWLTDNGITNAEEIVDATLQIAEGKRIAEEYTEALTNATEDEINALWEETGALDITRQAVFYYQLQKMLANEHGISTAQECLNLLTLAKNAGVTGKVIENLTELEKIYQEVASGTMSMSLLEKKLARAKELSTAIENQAFEFTSAVTPVVNYTNAKKDATKAEDKLTKALEKQKKALEELKSEYDELLAAINWFYDEQTEAIDKKIDKLNEENEALEKQKENLDLILSLVDSTYQDEIDALQEKIDAMDEANDEAERELALEKARLALTEARRKRVMLYEAGKGFVYQEDPRAVRDAEDELAELEAEDASEKLKKSIQDQIDKLQEFRDMWNAIPDAAEKAMQEAAMVAKYGADWKNIILSGDSSTIDGFQNEYTGVQNKINRNETLIDQLENQRESIEDMKALWEDAAKTYEENQYRMRLASFFGSDYENALLKNSTAYRQRFATEYANIMAQIKEVEDQIKLVENGGTITGITSNATDASGAVQQLDKDLITVGQKKGNVNDSTVYVVGDVTEAVETAKEKIDILKEALDKLNETKTEAETTVDEKIVDVSNVVSDTTTKVGEIQTIVDTLNDSLSTLEGLVKRIVDALQKLDGETLTSVIGKIGFIGDSSDTQSLFGVIHGAITKIGELVNSISDLDKSQLDTLITEFGLGGEEGVENLLSAVQVVSTLVGSEGDGNPDSLYTRIMNLANTIETISLVKQNFTDLTTEVDSVVLKVRELGDEINKLPSKKEIHIYEYIHRVEGDATGTALTGRGFATGSAMSGNAYMSGSWGLPYEQKNAIVGELGKELAVYPNGTYRVFDKPQVTNLPKGTVIFNHEQTRAILNRGRSSNISRLEKLGYKKIEDLSGNAFSSGTVNNKLFSLLKNGLMMGNNTSSFVPISQYSSYIPNIGEQGRNIEVNIGDVILHGVQNPEGMADAIIKRVGNVFTQKLSK